MATCRTCAYLRKCVEKATKEGYEHNENFDPKDGCAGIGYKSNTNADRIRAMSDEELAAWMAECNAYGENADASQWMPWLKQPVEEE